MFKRFHSERSKWWQTIKVCWSEMFVYRVNFFLQVLGPAFVFLVIKVSLWSSVYRFDESVKIGNYTLTQMLIYHLWVMLVTLLTTTYNSVNLSEDIRLGRISSYLIYPFSLGAFHAAQFLARQVVQVMIVMVTLLIVYATLHDKLPTLTLNTLLAGVFLSSMVSFFWFVLQYLIGLMSFWMEESWTLRVILHIVTQFCSGAIIPLDLYPHWARTILTYTPFPAISFIPTRLFLGLEHAWFEPFVLLMGWTVIMALISRLIWRNGLKLYTAAGM
jgi:ABC-2 type transport system permease protein